MFSAVSPWLSRKVFRASGSRASAPVWKGVLHVDLPTCGAAGLTSAWKSPAMIKVARSGIPATARPSLLRRAWRLSRRTVGLIVKLCGNW